MSTSIQSKQVNTLSFGFHIGAGQQLPMAAADQHNEIELNYVEEGEMLFRRGAETVKMAKGSTAIYWATVPHQVVEVSPNTRISWMVVPLTWFLNWKLPAAFNQRIVGGNILRLDENQTEIRIPSFSGWAHDFKESPELHQAIQLEIEAFFRRLAVSRLKSQSNEIAQVAGEHLHHHIERMISTITERFREPLSVQDIAESANLNPEYAMRLFRDRWGMTLLNFLQQQRIAEARRLLLLNDLLVIDVAFACGFQSLGRFYHVFKQQCGISPGAYRRSYASSKQRE